MVKQLVIAIVFFIPVIVLAEDATPEVKTGSENKPAVDSKTDQTKQVEPEAKPKPKLESKWSGEAELGYLNIRGDTDSESVYAKAKMVNEREYWQHKATFESTQKRENDIISAKRWYATEKSDNKLTEASYLFLAFTYEDDDFSGYDYQATEAFGYGYHIIKQDDLKLDAEAGIGARQSSTDLGEYTNKGIGKAAINLKWKASKTATFTQDLSAEADRDNTISRSESALKMAIVGNLAAKLSHRIKHSTDVPAGKKNTNTESVVTLVYSF